VCPAGAAASPWWPTASTPPSPSGVWSEPTWWWWSLCTPRRSALTSSGHGMSRARVAFSMYSRRAESSSGAARPSSSCDQCSPRTRSKKDCLAAAGGVERGLLHGVGRGGGGQAVLRGTFEGLRGTFAILPPTASSHGEFFSLGGGEVLLEPPQSTGGASRADKRRRPRGLNAGINDYPEHRRAARPPAQERGRGGGEGRFAPDCHCAQYSPTTLCQISCHIQSALF
jgi:hypothetical protein